jgi:hypothetical protein
MKHTNFIVAALLCFLAMGCQSESPDAFFEKVLLNTNYISDFAPEVFARRLEQETKEYPNDPSSKKKGDEAQQIVSMKILSIEKAMKDIAAIKVYEEDEKELKEKSLKLFETVLRAYKKEYTAYAKLCDTKGTEVEKQALLAQINSNYIPEANELFDQLEVMGKKFAEKHNLKVNWGN